MSNPDLSRVIRDIRARWDNETHEFQMVVWGALSAFSGRVFEPPDQLLGESLFGPEQLHLLGRLFLAIQNASDADVVAAALDILKNDDEE
jgi:hypothetical protein